MPNAPRTYRPAGSSTRGSKGHAAAERSKRYRLKGWTKQGGIREQVMARDGMVCQLCGTLVLGKGQAHIDHIKPVAEGGTDDLDNLRLLHHACHSKRTIQDRG